MDFNSKDYLPLNIRDREFFGEITQLLDYVISKEHTELEPVISKYKDFSLLKKDYLVSIVGEFGYDIIMDITSFSESEIRKLLEYLCLINFLKGTRSGLEKALDLMGINFSLKEWWEQLSYNENWVETTTNGKYHIIEYPIEFFNLGTINDKWTLEFLSPTTFSCTGVTAGLIGNGNITTDFIIPNGLGYYFKINKDGWDGTWVKDDLIRFDTYYDDKGIPDTFSITVDLIESTYNQDIINKLITFTRGYVYPILDQIDANVGALVTTEMMATMFTGLYETDGASEEPQWILAGPELLFFQGPHLIEATGIITV